MDRLSVRGWTVAEVFSAATADLVRGRERGRVLVALGVVPALWALPVQLVTHLGASTAFQVGLRHRPLHLVPDQYLLGLLFVIPWLWPQISRCGEVAIGVDVARGGRPHFYQFGRAIRWLPALSLLSCWPLATVATYAALSLAGLLESRVPLQILVPCLGFLAAAAVVMSLAEYAVLGDRKGVLAAAKLSVRCVRQSFPTYLGMWTVGWLLIALVDIGAMLGISIIAHPTLILVLLGFSIPIRALLRLAWSHILVRESLRMAQ